MSRIPTAIELERRSASVWTKVHPFFALAQLAAFFVSIGSLIAYALHAVDFGFVHVTVLVKIGLMVGAVVTGALWEHDVYGKWWFAEEFIVEDAMTANVFGLHLAYLAIAFLRPGDMPAILSMLAVAYTVYAANVGQYILSHAAMLRARDRLAVKAAA